MLCLILLLDNEILTIAYSQFIICLLRIPAPAHMRREDEIILSLNFLPGWSSPILLPGN